MPITYQWSTVGKVLDVKYAGVITADMMREAMDGIIALIETSDSPLVHTIVDSRDVEKYPTNIMEVTQLTRRLLQHPHYGWLVVFGDMDGRMRFVLQMVGNVLRIRLRMFATHEEAVDFLLSVDSSLSSRSAT